MKHLKKLPFAILVLAILFAAVPANPASAWATISTTFLGTPNPHTINRSGHQTMQVETRGANGVEVSVSPTVDPGFRVKRIVVTLNGKKICQDKMQISSCKIGDTFPGDVVAATVYFQGKEPGMYDVGWRLLHDGILTSYGTGISVVDKVK